MRFLLLTGLAFVVTTQLRAQQKGLPVKEWGSNSSNAFVFYISGDGGLNSFTISLCDNINKAEYSVTALNARSYFWNKKTPQQAANELADYLARATSNRKNQQIVLVGYSFGADVLPFIINKLPAALKSKIKTSVFIAPSTSTDFEIRLTDMFSQGKKRSMDVVAEMNRMDATKTVIIQDGDEKGFPVKSITLKNLTVETLTGSHHFDGDTKLVAQTVLKHCK